MLRCLLLTASLLVLATGCQAPAPAVNAAATAPAVAVKKEGAVAQAKKKAITHRYSPFVLNIQGSPFDKVSFKDVGVHLEDAEEAQALYEAIAESLAVELGQQQQMSLQAEVAYEEAITDPANHLSCGASHLYVDVWRAEAPSRWGYSLWSGCGDEDNFAWREIHLTKEVNVEDTLEHVLPLTRGIVESWAKAAAKNCYQKTC